MGYLTVLLGAAAFYIASGEWISWLLLLLCLGLPWLSLLVSLGAIRRFRAEPAGLDIVEMGEETELWLTYVGNGQPLTNKDFGSIQSRLFIYTYDPAKKDNLTLDDITIYGGKTTNSSYSGLRVVDYASDINGTQNAKNPLFYDRSENQRVSETGLHSKIYLGKFPAGVNVGFLLVGLINVDVVDEALVILWRESYFLGSRPACVVDGELLPVIG